MNIRRFMDSLGPSCSLCGRLPSAVRPVFALVGDYGNAVCAWCCDSMHTERSSICPVCLGLRAVARLEARAT